jgi:hydroxyacylglutathione hydrolase
MNIHQLYTHNNLRNFTYIIELNNKTAIVIDPWDADEINQQLETFCLKLTAIINTHEHWDHTQGNLALVEKHQCEVWAHENGVGKIPGLTRQLIANELITLDAHNQLLVLDTPGHTVAHCCFVIQENNISKAVFTGDTLFNAGVGNCHNGGDPETLFETIQQHFQNLDDEIVVYPGHDYLENNLRFSLNFEPSNKIAQQWLVKVHKSSYVPGSLKTTIGDEKMFNSFMRLNNEELINNLSFNVNKRVPTPKQVFLALRALRNKW